MFSDALNEEVERVHTRGILQPRGFELKKLRVVVEGVLGGWAGVEGMGWTATFQRVTQIGQLINLVSFLEASLTFSHIRVGVHTLIISCVLAVENEFPRDW